VSVDGRPALVLSSSPTEIVAVAPGLGGVAQIQAHVMVQVRGTNSSTERSLTITRPAAAYFRPRYFPAPSADHPGHEHVFISSELGPALVLSDKADAPSLGERAERVAKALNATMDAAAAGGKTAPSFEVRDKPAAGLGLAGNPALLVAVTAADAAAYDEAWESAPKARHTQAAIAAFWTALLQDHLALFVLHQRPFRVLEVSPRGKVLAEIYTESNRRAGTGVGVPTGVVSPLTTILEKAFREMALVVPGEGQVRAAGAAVEGRWEGTMEESDVGVRGIAVRLRADGTNLGGTLKATSGALAMDVPLKDVSYENGTLKFSIMMHGTPKYFVGTGQGETLAGQILSAPSAKDAVGRFTLRFIG
jgi:hypothetical protein